MWFASRNDNAAIVSVGFAVVPVGKTPDPTMNKFLLSWLCRFALTTDFLGSLPIQVVPIIWPEPKINGKWKTSVKLLNNKKKVNKKAIHEKFKVNGKDLIVKEILKELNLK